MGDCRSAVSAGCEFIHCAYGYGDVPDASFPKAKQPADIVPLAKRIFDGEG